MRQVPTAIALLVLCSTFGANAAPPPRLLQDPSLSATRIAFAFAGEIWTVPREGGEASRLASGQLRNRRPLFSPDGTTVAFTGTYDENEDVYVVPAGGGEPRRLTHHPGPDVAVGFTPDGKKVLFVSMRRTARDLPKLFTVPVAGGPAEELPLPSGADACYSPDGKRLAYVPFPQWQAAWKKYRGGQTTPVWIADLADSKVAKVPRENSNDRRPMWVGETVYFLSDRNGPATLFAFDVKGGAVREVVKNPGGFDVQSASAGPGAIVFDQFGELKLLDLASGATKTVPVTISADLPQVRAGFRKVEPEQVLHVALSPTGKRVLLEARGEILSVPAEKGDARNLTQSPGVADRDPSFSPDGKSVAWLSDESGEYALHLAAPDGMGPVRKLDLGLPPSFFYAPRWSPDSKRIALTDKRMNLWVVDVEKGTRAKVDSDLYDTPFSNLDPAWSPDSRWLAYAKQLPNHFRAVFVHSLEEKKSRQVTDGRSDATSPRFDRGGKYLFFLASTDAGLAQGWLDMTSMSRPVTSSLYAAVPRKDLPSPVAPESDEEGAGDAKDAKDAKDSRDAKSAEEKADGGKGDAAKGGTDAKNAKNAKDAKDAKDARKPPEPVKIDFAGLDQRIVALPVDRANWVALEAGAEGIVFLLQAPVAYSAEDYFEFGDENPAPLDVHRFDLKARKVEKFVEKIDGGSGAYGGQPALLVSFDGTKVLYAQKKSRFLVPSDKAPKPGDGTLKTEGLEVWVDPRAEWRQMYRETWRLQRDFLYDPGAHGLDLAAAERTYAPFVDGVGGRDDLNLLFEEMLGTLVLGHVFVNGGAVPEQEKVSVGLLGADFTVAEGRYRISRILAGENWNPKLKAPLTQPGVDVKEGDFLLAVNGQELKGDDDVHRLFLGTAGKQTVLTVGSKSDGSGSRRVTVVPAPSEGTLRLRTWMEENRKKVDALSGGRVGYVYIPDTFAGGFTNFNRYYFAEVGKEALVLDERFNHGGNIADYIVDLLARTPTMANASREGEDVVDPAQTVFGPKVMLANQMSGSGGDALPWLFRKAKLGPIVGKRTWGGLVGIGGYPALIDGGSVTAPRWGLYGTEGEWEVENVGIAPDVEVEEDPALVRQGKEPQLERAVQLALEALAKSPPVKPKRPKYPDYGPRLPKRVP
ncbi:MAG: PD40 domain-containing protein [Holophagales bacterium]|nr:PD40 domain-containing protein [Holophagales bacterium]